MKMMNCCLAAFCLLALCVAAARAETEVETVIDGLNNPCGVAIQPGTGDIFVADSGAGRVIRVVDGKASDVIVGFPSDVYGKGPMYNIGPLGLLFLDEKTLVVGGGGKPDGEELLRVYEVPDAGAEAIKADDLKQSFSLAASDELKGEGNFYALTKTDSAIYVTCNGDDTKGWVARATLDGTKIGAFERYLATKEATEVDAPVGITTSPRGELVVGQMGEITVPGDALLTFYSEDKKILLNLETGLHDITALAYSTQKRGKKRQLYALDFAWNDTTQGGLFRLVGKNKNQEVNAKKIASLDKPTALVFAEDGTAYITVIGTAEEGSDAKPGKLLKIAPGL